VGISLNFLNQLTSYSIILKRNKTILHHGGYVDGNEGASRDWKTEKWARREIEKKGYFFTLNKFTHDGSRDHHRGYHTPSTSTMILMTTVVVMIHNNDG